MNKKIYIYNKGFLHSYLLNFIVPAIRCFINENYEVQLLSGGNDFAKNNYFFGGGYLVKNIPVHKNNVSHLIQLIIFLMKINSNKLIVMTENQAILVGLIKKIFRLQFTIILYKQGAIAEERYFLNKKMIIKLFFYYIEKISLNFADEIIFVSNSMENYYKKTFFWGKKSYLIYNKIVSTVPSSLLLKKKSSADCIEIVYSGSLTKWQSIDYILKIFSYLNQCDFLKFKILTQDKFDFNNKVNKLTIASSEPDEIVRELSKSDIGIIIRDSNILNKVASPLKIGEYLSAGLPIILTPDIGDYSQLIINNNLGCIVTMNDIHEDVDKIIEFIKYYQNNKAHLQRTAFLLGKKYFWGHADYKKLL